MHKILLLLAALSFGMVFAQDYVFGITYDAGGKFDASFNEGTWNGLSRAVEELEAEGLDIAVLEFEGSPDTAAQGQRQIANQGAELIIAPGFLQQPAIQSVSSEFPNTNFVLIDAVAENPNVRSVLFKEHEGSFMVGYLAGTMTQTGTVGFVGGMDIPLIHSFEAGYIQGVKAACPDCKVISNYVGVTPAAWNDPAKAKELSASQHAQGADIIYHAAGASGNGVIDFVNETMCYNPASLGVTLRETPLTEALANIEKGAAYEVVCDENAQPMFFIGVDSNQNPLGDTDSNPDTLNFGLSSMLKRVDVAAYNGVMDVVNGEFTAGTLVLGLAEGGVGYALDEYNEDLISEELQAELEAVKQKIISGEIVVEDPDAPQ